MRVVMRTILSSKELYSGFITDVVFSFSCICFKFNFCLIFRIGCTLHHQCAHLEIYIAGADYHILILAKFKYICVYFIRHL